MSSTGSTGPIELNGRGAPEQPWHALDATSALTALGSQVGGLSQAEAARRLRIHGANRLVGSASRSAWRRLGAQFHNLLIYVLLGSAAITAVLGHALDTAVIVGVVVINAVIGFVQEGRAEEALAAIRNLISPRASVLRDGRRVTIDAAEVVPGDIVLLEAGDQVAADTRLLKARNLRIDEALLTGESVPAEKAIKAVAAAAPIAERGSMAFAGTLVRAGQGSGLVVATGATSEIGRISTLLARVEQLETPLIRKMNGFAQRLTVAILALSAVALAYAVTAGGYAVSDGFMVVVGMAVAAIPEGLPAVMTIALAIGVQRMAGRHAIIRRLPAVETLGSVSTICTDKTGTLTRNEMTVARVMLADRTISVEGDGYAPEGRFAVDGRPIEATTVGDLMRLARHATLCSDARVHGDDGSWRVAGDPMEGALVTLGGRVGQTQEALVAAYPRLDEIPFDAAHRYMATLHHSPDGDMLACAKGAPERLIAMCRCVRVGDTEQPIDAVNWERRAQSMAAGGYRVLAIASRSMPAGKQGLHFADVEGTLTLDGIVGLIDPPRPDAIVAVRECHSAGIAVKMITGDHAATAAAIAAEIGLRDPQRVATGADIDGWSDQDLKQRAAVTNVFARTSPEHKLRLVTALQSDGAVIAMTGDGVNDAPALKRADVGVAMGISGTEAAKEAAEMVLADDNFASIVAAVREGRTVYDNLVKMISWTLPTNGGETLIILAAIALGATLPVTPVQILWINMVTTVGLGLVLAFEASEADIMRRPPRDAAAPLLSGFLLWRVVLVSVLFAIGAFALFAWSERRGDSHSYARTLVVNAVVVMEIFYLFSIRYLHAASLTWRGVVGTPAVLIGVGAIILLQLAFTYLPASQLLFDTRAVSLMDGLVVVSMGVALFAILEVEKLLRRGWIRQRALSVARRAQSDAADGPSRSEMS